MTLDFDGSGIITKGHAEGTAVGFNKAKKGGRSYYPLFCRVAQTGQLFDLLHRPGKVHAPIGADEIMLQKRISQSRISAPQWAWLSGIYLHEFDFSTVG